MNHIQATIAVRCENDSDGKPLPAKEMRIRMVLEKALSLFGPTVYDLPTMCYQKDGKFHRETALRLTFTTHVDRANEVSKFANECARTFKQDDANLTTAVVGGGPVLATCELF